ncbi:MAG: DUF4337 family protein [Chthoniobacteraceae bacterium]
MSEGLPHHAENPQQKQIGIFISVLAVVMAIVSAVTNQQANQMLAKKVESSNGYAWFQAKKQRSYVNEMEMKRLNYELAGTPTEAQRKLIENEKADLVKANEKYEVDNKKIKADADADKAAAEVAEHRHHWFELSEICLHIAVVLCSLVLLTDLKIFLRLGIIVTVAGLVLAGYAQLGSHSHHAAHDEQQSAPAKAAGAAAH